MADKMTRKQALTNAIAYAKGCGDSATAEVLGKMLEQVSKPRKAVVSKARKMNENLAKQVHNLVADNHDTAVTTKDIVALGLPEITTTQKAAAVLRIATEMGLFEKVVDGKKVGYKKVITE